MRPYSVTYTPADDDDNGLATTVGGTSGVAFVQIATSAGDNLAHLILITPTGSITGNFTITGTDANGRAQTEVLATDTVNAVTSVKYYLTVTEVLAPSGIGAESVIIGWTDDMVGPIFPTDWRQGPPYSQSLGVVITGTISVTVQYTMNDVLGTTTAPTWASHGTLVTKTATADSNLAYPVRAVRLLVNSVTAGATVQFNLLQA